MVAMGHSSATADSLRVEAGEKDTSAPFRAVKDVADRVGEGAFSGGKPAIKTAKSHPAEIVLAKETQLHLAQNVLNKLKGRLENAKTTKSQALEDLEKAKRTVEELTHKLKTVNELKNSAIKVTEAAKSRAKQIEETNSSDLPGTKGYRGKGLETAMDQYRTLITELDAAKQELLKARQDRDATLEVKMAAFDRAKEAELAVKVNMEKAGKLSGEISAVKESIAKVKLASLHVQQEQAKTFAEKDSLRQFYKAKLEESAKRLHALKNEFDLELTKNLEAKLSETINQTADLQRQMEDARASDLESMQAVTSELDGANGSLQKVVDEESSLRSLVDSLKVKLENVKKEHSELKEREAKTESIAGNLHVKLRRSKYELESFIAEESKTRGNYEEMISTLEQLSLEPENAQRVAEEMKKEAKKLKLEAEGSRIALERAEKQLRVSLEEAEATKVAETRALDEIKMLSERKKATRASTPESGANITISKEEVESLNHRVEESNNIAEMKVAAAMAQVEAVKASENNTLKRFDAIQKEIEDMKAATADALKRAEMAEAAKKVVEGELQRWREREQKKAAEAAARIQTEPSPQQCRNQKQNPPDKIVPVQKLKKSKSSISRKAVLPNFSCSLNRRNNQIDGGSPSYRVSEKPL
ncbi:TOUCH-REGULATED PHOSPHOPROTEIN1 [Hibiscus trionum]|uniref:TOUCH-REGULATED PHOSPHOPROTEIN1 n=1 Tax=Hibiscus trionum TaxID=183268 RepID=A0A9W7M236_HIBTR|nr:TOUCH-REGULATED PHOSPHOPROTEIN1 [Hibiscus trionum]